ncbi:MAG: 30S ribosomal protein S15, partial [Candidatus Aenigmarchaeota archaeon]|nr:30S ribosomal protein S15 [Candidatus Aenigmarchaeota archaeon]
LEKNKKDTKNKHAVELMESKIRRLGKYYVKKGRLPKDWKYNIEQAKLLVK